MRKREFETERGALRYWVSENDEETARLVFLPGLTADHRLFNKQVDYFSQRARCLVWDPLPTMSCSIAFGDKSWDNFKNLP